MYFVRFLKALRAFFTAFIYVTNLVFWFIPLMILGLFYYLIPINFLQKILNQLMEKLAFFWITTNNFIQKLIISIKWEITGLDQLSYEDWYLLIANHQSWTDVLVLQYIFNHKIPPLKFFLKKELLWTLPFASWACWLLGFPFMHRYSKKVLEKNPKLKNKDIEATKRACIRFKSTPTTVANFIEGTRFTKKKLRLQRSPYQNLLRPRAGGIGFSLAVLGSFFHKILNVTIIYSSEKYSLYDFLAGNIKKITLHIESLPITPEWLGDYQNDRQFRARLQKKLNNLWLEKDRLITKEKNYNIQS